MCCECPENTVSMTLKWCLWIKQQTAKNEEINVMGETNKIREKCKQMYGLVRKKNPNSNLIVLLRPTKNGLNFAVYGLFT